MKQAKPIAVLRRAPRPAPAERAEARQPSVEERDTWIDAHHFHYITRPAPAPAAADPVVLAFQQGKSPEGCAGQLCSIRCAHQRWIGPIAALHRPNLFGCMEHGHAHECTRANCRITFTHPDGHITCVFSGLTLSFHAVYMGAFGDIETETTHLDDDEPDWDAADTYEKREKPSKRARRAPPEPEAAPAPPRRPAVRRITNTETIARDVIHAVFANSDGRDRLLAVLLQRARARADRAVALMRKRAPLRVQGMLVTDARRVPHDLEIHEALAGPFRELACVRAVYPWPDAPVALRPPRCAPDDYVSVSEWLRRTIVRLWGILERCGCCKNAVAAFHGLCVYVALTAAAGEPLRVHVYGDEDVLVPASEAARRGGLPADWIKLVEHLSTPNCFIQTGHFTDGRTALMQMLRRLTGKFDRSVYIDLRAQLHELHSIHERGGSFSKLRAAAGAHARAALPDL